MHILPYSHCHIANQRTLDYGLGGEHVYIFHGKMRTITKIHCSISNTIISDRCETPASDFAS